MHVGEGDKLKNVYQGRGVKEIKIQYSWIDAHTQMGGSIKEVLRAVPPGTLQLPKFQCSYTLEQAVEQVDF